MELFLQENETESADRNEAIKNVLDSLKKRIQITGSIHWYKYIYTLVSNIISEDTMKSVINELYGNNQDYEDNMFSVFFLILINISIMMHFQLIKSLMIQ